MKNPEGNPHSHGVPAKPRRQYGAGRSGSVYASKIYKQYGNDAIKVVQKTPYSLAHDISGIGFLTADRIAEKMGFDRQSPERAQAGIIYVLHQCSDEGHVFMPREFLLAKAWEILEVDDGILVAALTALAAERRIVIETLPETVEAVYLAKFHLSEVQTAKRLLALQAAPRSIREIKVDTGPDVPARLSSGCRTSCPSH